MGADTIEFVAGATALELSELSARSSDWVTMIDGGPGDDTLTGTGARDRIDGGAGSDTIFGLGGDDRLWGNENGIGPTTDIDRLFGGQGHDDLLGGQGRNFLYAWTRNPQPGSDRFGVFGDSNGSLHDDDGDLDKNGKLDSDGVSAPFLLEDTGLNRVLGGPRADELFGGTGLGKSGMMALALLFQRAPRNLRSADILVFWG